MFEANKKQAPLKSYPLKIRIDSVNKNLKDKEKSLTRQNHQPKDSMCILIATGGTRPDVTTVL